MKQTRFRRLGDLEDHAARLELRGLHQLDHPVGQVDVGEGQRRQVGRHRDLGPERRLPPDARGRRLAQHHPGEVVDQSVHLHRPDELVGRDDAALRVTPANHRLRALDPPGRELDLGLEERPELVAGQARADPPDGERLAVGRRVVQRVGDLVAGEQRPAEAGADHGGRVVEIDQGLQPGRGDRLLDDPEDPDAERPGHVLDRGQQPAVERAGQDDRGRDAGLAQVAHELHAVHAGHVEIADDEVDLGAQGLEHL